MQRVQELNLHIFPELGFIDLGELMDNDIEFLEEGIIAWPKIGLLRHHKILIMQSADRINILIPNEKVSTVLFIELEKRLSS